MKKVYQSAYITAFLFATGAMSVATAASRPETFDLTRFRYQIDAPSVFNNQRAQQIEKNNGLLDKKYGVRKATETVNPEPIHSFAPSNITGNIDAPNGELWYYTGNFVYHEIPPHDNVYFTDRILQEYTFDIYNSEMELIGTIKDKMDYQDNEVRTVLCDITPVATRNFFNTDDKIEMVISLAVNIEGGGNNYRSVVYALDGKKDAEGYDEPVDVLDDLIGDVIEGPETDGSDNFYITFMTDELIPESDDDSFWSYLMAQKVHIRVYGKALDDNGPRMIFDTIIRVIQLPGDQQDVPALISMRRGDDIIFSVSYYKEPFYNQYDDPFSEEMTQRENNSLLVDLYKATQQGLTKFSSTEIATPLDPMPDSSGNPTALFSYYSVGSLLYSGDFLFDAPGASAEKPDFIVTRGNYQTSTDDIIQSYFTYKNNGTLKNTLFEYADGTISLGNLPGFEPQQMFVSKDAYGYLYNFVDIYSAKKAVTLDADYYYDDDSDPELMTVNVARYLDGNSYKYVFELRYPLVDDNENDILRFIHIDNKGKFDHFDFVNMGVGVLYAQSLLTTEAVAPHAYSTSDIPAYMMLIKRGIEGSEANIEELMVAEIESEDTPEGKTLLQVGPDGNGSLASIVPEFAEGDKPGRLFIYYYNTGTSRYALDVYHLPLDEDLNSVDEIVTDGTGFAFDGNVIAAEGDIKVYALDGRMVAAGHDKADISTLNAGIYIAIAGDKAYKIVKK